MTDGVLVHLLEPADWRAALAAGAVTPPSLATVGHVHLSTPEQVHLPARALFPGRRDLVLLVVDPARLGDPVRWEPGRPEDPEGMLFPHLYGPLPAAAVVAAVPYRPPTPPVLPAPDDVLGRALALLLSVPVRRAGRVVDVPGGVAVVEPHSGSSVDDRLLLTAPVDAATVSQTAARVGRDAGWTRAAATLCWPGASAVAGRLAGDGWDSAELVLMARRTAPLRGGDRADVVDRCAVHPRDDRVLAVTDVVVREQGRVVAAGQLRVDGATAAIDPVRTDPAFRGRGHARAVLARLVTLAAEAGCDLVVLQTAAGDRRRQWYARAGFAEVGSVWDVARPAQTGARTESSR